MTKLLHRIKTSIERRLQLPASEGRTSMDRNIKQAIRELNAYSDRELADLGVARRDILHVVNHGRPGIDRVA